MAHDIVERLLDYKHRWGNHQDRKDGAAEILHLRAQVARDDEHYNAVRAMSEKHRALWVEAAQERDRLRESLRKIMCTPAMPFPDPGAHSWRAWGSAVHHAWNSIQHIARAALADKQAAAVAADPT